MSVVAVDLNTGDRVYFDETVADDIKLEAIMSSTTISGVFPSVKLEDYVLVDGGTFGGLDVTESILKCREFGFSDSDIIVDTILCTDKVLKLNSYTLDESKYLNAYELFTIKENLHEYYGNYEDVVRVMRAYPDVNWRHLIAPTVPLNTTFRLFDNTETIKEMMD